MDITMKLRADCGHDSRSVDGCTNCEAADIVEDLRRELLRTTNALWRASGDNEEMVSDYLAGA